MFQIIFFCQFYGMFFAEFMECFKTPHKQGFARRILRVRRGAARNGADGVETYSEASIGASNKAYTKILPQKK